MLIYFNDRFIRQWLDTDFTRYKLSYGRDFDKCLIFRVGLPAYLHYNGKIKWYENKIHCLTGPAITHIDGNMEYWVNGKKVTVLEVLMS